MNVPSLQLTRRDMLRTALLGACVPPMAACSPRSAATETLWQQWLADWRKMEAIARRRNWEVTALAVALPLDEERASRYEKTLGMSFPPQLRDVLTTCSASVRFGWRVPSHLRPMERIEHLHPRWGGLRDHIWNVELITQTARFNFEGWKRDLAGKDLSEAPNTPEIWEHQFALHELPNGDMLTIDVSKPEGPQPVRYFSHEMEGLHGHAIAPDFYSFISTYAALGCAGSTHDDWFSFIEGQQNEKRISPLSATGEGAKTWIAWRDTVDVTRHKDDPPTAVLGLTTADQALLTSAHANNEIGVRAALAAGAKPDAIWNPNWGNPVPNYEAEFWTAITHAVRHGNLALVDVLLKSGATLNTRHLPMNTAIETAQNVATVEGLIERGARLDGWRYQRHWPLHLLITRRGQTAALSREDYEKQIRDEEARAVVDYDLLIADAKDDETRELYRGMKARAASPEARAELEARVALRLATYIDKDTYLAMLEALLTRGAAPDAPWDNGITMLMQGGIETSQILLRHGASVNTRDRYGRTPLHWAQSPEKALLLLAHGADINTRATPPAEDKQSLAYTPLQAALLQAARTGVALAKTLLEKGADPKIKDGQGHSTLAYCLAIEAFKLISEAGVDPKELQPKGRTLLHNLAVMTNPPRVGFAEEVSFFKHLLSLGFDINARDDDGQTLLHLATARAGYDGAAADFQLLLDNGADKSIKDKQGRRAYDLCAPSLTKVREVLR